MQDRIMEEKSKVITSIFTLYFVSRLDFIALRSLSSLETITKLFFSFANVKASSLPNPDEAPIIKYFIFLNDSMPQIDKLSYYQNYKVSF